jgi:hypothetical protein
MWRLLVSAILLYVTLDFADPMIPGALNFDADQSVDGVYAKDVREHAPSVAVSARPDVGVVADGDRRPVSARAVTPSVHHSVARITGPRTLVSESRSSSPDDH